MLTVRVIDANGGGTGIKVNGEGEIGVSMHTHPPTEEKIASLPFRKYFTSSAGSSDMRVNGAVTNQIFAIRAVADRETYIKTINIKLADAGSSFDKFGNLTALTNGVRLVWSSITLGDFEIHEGLKTNLSFFRLSGQQPIIIDLSGGGADAIIVSFDLAEVFGNRFGIRLKKGTTDSLQFIIRDDVTGVDEFNIIGYGLQI